MSRALNAVTSRCSTTVFLSLFAGKTLELTKTIKWRKGKINIRDLLVFTVDMLHVITYLDLDAQQMLVNYAIDLSVCHTRKSMTATIRQRFYT